MASSSLLTTVPADFLSVIYLLNYMFKNAAESTMDHLNGLADNLAAYLENPLAKEEDDW